MSNLFKQVATQFSEEEHRQYIEQMEEKFQIKTYHLSNLKTKTALEVYQDLSNKYRKGMSLARDRWKDNQRKIYVWFVICYLRLKAIEPQNLIYEPEDVWEVFSEIFFQKDSLLLKYQYRNILKCRKLNEWTEEEDLLLRESFVLFKEDQKRKWNEMAKNIFFATNGTCFKTPKQCSERWQNHLNPNISKKQIWTSEEDRIIFEQRKIGWAKIVPLLHSKRNQHMIKNRFKSLLNKKKKELKTDDDNYAIREILKKQQRSQRIEKNSPSSATTESCRKSQQTHSSPPPQHSNQTTCSEAKQLRPFLKIEEFEVSQQSNLEMEDCINQNSSTCNMWFAGSKVIIPKHKDRSMKASRRATFQQEDGVQFVDSEGLVDEDEDFKKNTSKGIQSEKPAFDMCIFEDVRKNNNYSVFASVVNNNTNKSIPLVDDRGFNNKDFLKESNKFQNFSNFSRYSKDLNSSFHLSFLRNDPNSIENLNIVSQMESNDMIE